MCHDPSPRVSLYRHADPDGFRADVGGGVMRALSIRQPWAWAILHAGKDVETRSWSTRYRGLVAIHAAQSVDREAQAAMAKAGYRVPVLGKGDPDLGAYVGTARLVDVVTHSDSGWWQGPYGFVLTDAVAFDTPVPGRGMLGLFTPSDRDLMQIQAAMTWAAFGQGDPERAKA